MEEAVEAWRGDGCSDEILKQRLGPALLALLEVKLKEIVVWCGDRPLCCFLCLDPHCSRPIRSIPIPVRA